MLEWPKRARAALRKLFQPLQEVDVYVEDTNDEAFYRTLLNHATEGRVRIARVFALNGRSEVLQAANGHNHAVRRALFIIDGDLAWVRGEVLPVVQGLHCLNAYCIENLLVCRNAFTTLMSQEMAVNESDAEAMLKFSGWYNRVMEPLADLFAAFATVNEVNPSVRTVSRGVGCLCSEKTGKSVTELDLSKVESARESALRDARSATNDEHVQLRYDTIRTRIRQLPDPLYAVSGKDFVIPLLDFEMQRCGCRIKRKALRMRLAVTGDRRRFSELAKALCDVAGA